MSESFVKDFISKLPVTAGTAFDIGAMEGRYTNLLAAKFIKVYAFEPHPENMATLHKKTADTLNVQRINMAVSNMTGEGILYLAKSNKGGHSISRSVAENGKWGHSKDKHIKANHIKLDDFMNDYEINDLQFIKMDIEGAEAFAFKGAVETLKNNKLDIMLETHQSYECKLLYDFLTELGYSWYDDKLRKRTPRTTKDHVIRPDTHYLITNKRHNFNVSPG